MKKVFTKSEDVIHLWANKVQDEARCSNVFFYKNGYEKSNFPIIYSYGRHYELSRFIDENTVLINDSGYSVTTSKHISEISYATRQYKQFFKTKTDLDSIESDIKHRLLPKLAKARKPEIYINQILEYWECLNEFLEYTKAKKYKSNPKYRFIKNLVKNINLDSESLQKKIADQKKKEERAKKAKAKKELSEKLEKFNNYEISSFRVGDEDFLRISANGENVETSQGVRVTISDAKILYRMILAGKDIKGHKISHYSVTSINGTLKIGCHNINIDSVHKVGKQII